MKFLALAFLLASSQAQQFQNPSDESLIAIGKATMSKFRAMLKADWETLQRDELTGIEVSHLRHSNGSTASLRATVKSPHSPQVFFSEFYVKAESIPTWSSIVTYSKKLKQIDGRTRVLFQNLRAQAALPLADREFLLLQRTEVEFTPPQSLTYRTAYQGIDYESPLIPKPAPGVQRADVGISGFEIKPDSENPKGTEFTWVSTVQFGYTEVPKDLAAIFERFNTILYVEALVNRVDEVVKAKRNKQ